MNVVGKVSSFITQGVYSVATPFHPFGGAVDIIVVQQQDGSFRSTPWYVRFGKFQGVLKGAEKVVRIEVNGVEANFHMYLDNSGEAYFVREVISDKESKTKGGVKDSDSLGDQREDRRSDYFEDDDDLKHDEFSRHDDSESGDGESQMQDERVTLAMERFERTESDNSRFYEFQDEQSPDGSTVELSEYGSSRFDNLDNVEHGLESQTSSEVILVSVDGLVLTAPITSAEKNVENVELKTPRFNLGPVGGPDLCEDTAEFSQDEAASVTVNLGDESTSQNGVASADVCNKNYDVSVVEHQLELREEDTENHYNVQEIEVEERKSNVCTNTSTNNASAIRRDEVFKSCLELPELLKQDRNANHQEIDPLSENHEIAENRKESLGSPKSTNEAENLNLGTASNNYGLSVSGSDNPGYVASPDLQVAVDHLQNNALDAEGNWPNCSPVNSAGHDEKQEEHIELPAPESVQSGQQESSLKAECLKAENSESQTANGEDTSDSSTNGSYHLGFEISLCRNLLHAGMGRSAAAEVFYANRVSEEEYKLSAVSIIKNENLVVQFRGKYFPWEKAAPIILGAAVYGVDLPVEATDEIPVDDEQMSKTREDNSGMSSTPSGRRWRLWPIPFRRVKTLEHTSSNFSQEEVFVDTESDSQNQPAELTPTIGGGSESPHKKIVRTNVPSSDQIASLNLKEGQNVVTLIFSTRVLGVQKVDAHIYLWKWNARIVISDVDGTITKSDVLGQFMPLVGKDWTHSGIARLFSTIKENGYQLLFLSARAIVQSYLTKSFLVNLKQDGKNLPTGPVVISPDGLIPSLYREVIRRAPHEFKIACLQDIKALFPPDYNPFYAGFGNRDTDELSYRKIGIPKGKIFIINPKGEVAINNRIDVKSYTSLHTLVHDMFPPTSLVEQEDYNSWNFWKVPLPDLDDL